MESSLTFAGFLVFHCPLKSDAVETLKMLADSSHRVSEGFPPNLVVLLIIGRQCIMITGDNPLTAVHVAQDVEIVDRDVLILDVRENPAHEAGKYHCTLAPPKCSLSDLQIWYGEPSMNLKSSQSIPQSR